jgi:hypothetical protein
MKRNGTLIFGCCAVFTLALTVAPHSAIREGTHERRNLSKSPGPHSDLQRDENDLAGDIRNLRHDLRRGMSSEKIAKERNNVREDWRHIVLDRDPHALEPGAPMMEMARLRRHHGWSAKRHS